MLNRRFGMAGGLAGVAAVCCYLLAIAVPWPETQLGNSSALLTVSAFPILGIVFSHALHRFVALERPGDANSLGLLFATGGFVTVLAMIVVQLAVGASIGDISAGLDETAARALRRGLRMIDLGLDVAWDLLIGTALILWGAATYRRRGLGPAWAVPCGVLGVALIGLNVATFPWPPADRGLFDVGPFVGLFMLALAGRVAYLGRH